MAMLKIEGVHFSIAKLDILKGVDLEVQEGETVGIIGPNGSGKTTLFNCISGFNKVQKGTITFKNKNVTKVPAYKRARGGIGRVFQNFGIFREMTVLENVQIALESKQSVIKNLFPWSKQTNKNKFSALRHLAMVELGRKAKQKAASLSGGQMRLLEIIRTLAMGADLFLLDEPTAGVSPKMKSHIIKIIKKLKTMNKTVLIIEHDINFIQEFCDRIVVLDQGRVALEDAPDRIKENEKLKEIYFGKDT